jgi:hypothetical protein
MPRPRPQFIQQQIVEDEIYELASWDLPCFQILQKHFRKSGLPVRRSARLRA